MTVIIATHDPQIAAHCDRLIRLRDGAAAFPGGPMSLARPPRNLNPAPIPRQQPQRWSIGVAPATSMFIVAVRPGASRTADARQRCDLSVGLAGFEPATSATQTRRASQAALQPVPG